MPYFKTFFSEEISQTRLNITPNNPVCYHNQSPGSELKPLDLNLLVSQTCIWGAEYSGPTLDGRIVLNPGPPDKGFVLGLSPMLQGPLPLTARNDLHNPSQDLLETKLSSTDYPLKNKRTFTK